MTDLQDNVAMQQQVQRTEVIRGYSYDICIISGNYGSCSQRLAIRLRLLKFQVLSIMGAIQERNTGTHYFGFYGTETRVLMCLCATMILGTPPHTAAQYF